MKYDETELQKRESKKMIFIGNRKCMKLVFKKHVLHNQKSEVFWQAQGFDDKRQVFGRPQDTQARFRALLIM